MYPEFIEPSIEQGSVVYNLSLYIRSRRHGLRVCTRLLEDNHIDPKHPRPTKGLVAELVEASTGFTRRARVRFCYNPLFELP